MHVLITGAAGMIGRKLVDRLVADGNLGGRPIAALTLLDIVAPPRPAFAGAVTATEANLADPGAIDSAIAARPDVIFHLAAVVPGQAKADFEKGYSVNPDAPGGLFEAIRHIGEAYRPRVVFASSI